MTPKISVFLCTYRPGGIELAVRSLSRQTFRDFEVVIADELHDVRSSIWVDALYSAGVQIIKFADMSRSPFPRSGAPIAHNECIRVAEGELCIFMSDYALVQPDWLAEHWRVYREQGCPAMGPFQFVMPPKEWLSVSTPIPVRADSKTAYSIFYDGRHHEWDTLQPQVGPINAAAGYAAAATSSQDPKLTMPEGIVQHVFYYNKNEAVPLAALKAVNGADEDFVGLHPYDDSALSLRLHTYGIRWWLAPQLLMKIVQVRHFMETLQWDKPVESAQARYERVKTYIRVTQDYRTPNGLIK